MNGGPLVGCGLVARHVPNSMPLAPRQTQLPARLRDHANVPAMAERAPRLAPEANTAEAGDGGGDAGDEGDACDADDDDDEAAVLPPFVLAPMGPAGTQAPLPVDHRYRRITMHIVPNDGTHRIVQNADGTQNVMAQRPDGTWHTILRRGRARLGGVGTNTH